MTVKDIIERIGQVLVDHPELFRKNVQILNDFGIDIKMCKKGPGIDVLGYFDLANRLLLIEEMGYAEEVKNNKNGSLELIRGYSMTMNYNDYKDLGNGYVKGAA